MVIHLTLSWCNGAPPWGLVTNLTIFMDSSYYKKLCTPYFYSRCYNKILCYDPMAQSNL